MVRYIFTTKDKCSKYKAFTCVKETRIDAISALCDKFGDVDLNDWNCKQFSVSNEPDDENMIILRMFIDGSSESDAGKALALTALDKLKADFYEIR